MSYGFLSVNSGGTIQIDETFKNAHLTETGVSITDAFGDDNAVLTKNYDSEEPIIFIKPSKSGAYQGSPIYNFNGTVNRALIRKDPTTGVWSLTMWEVEPYSYALFAASITPIESSDTFGLVVNDSTGSTTYSSNRIYPRVTHILTKPAGIQLPVTFDISGYTSMPWIYANALPLQTFTTEQSWAMSGASVWVNASFTQVTIDYPKNTKLSWYNAQNLQISIAIAKIGEV